MKAFSATDVRDGGIERATGFLDNTGTLCHIDWRCDDCLNMSAEILLLLWKPR